MRLAILVKDDKVIAEFKPSEVKNKLKEYLDKYDFDVAWGKIENELLNKLRQL